MNANPALAALNVRAISFPTAFTPVEQTAAEELARLTGTTARKSPRPGKGVNVALASRGWSQSRTFPQSKAAAAPGWMWLQLADDGTGEIVADTGALLYAAVRLLAHGLGNDAREKLARGLFLPATFPHHRPHWDVVVFRPHCSKTKIIKQTEWGTKVIVFNSCR